MDERHLRSSAVDDSSLSEPESAGVVKQKTARLSVASNTLLVVMKLVVGCAIGSVGIISEAIHSGIDLVAAGIAFISVKKASEPADAGHRFGHGKFEDFSGLIEAILIFVASVLIIREALGTIIAGSDGLVMESLGAGMAVMLLSAGVNWYVSSRLMRAAKKTESIALESDAWHLRTDVYTSLAMFAGLVAIRLTGLVVLDAVFALGVAVIIIKAAYDLTKRAFSDLTDHSLPPEEVEQIRQIIRDHSSDIVDFHALRTRRSGSERFIDLHLVVSRDDSLPAAYDLVKHIESDIRHAFPGANVSIRVEPCAEQCTACTSVCLSGEDEPDRRQGV